MLGPWRTQGPQGLSVAVEPVCWTEQERPTQRSRSLRPVRLGGGSGLWAASSAGGTAQRLPHSPGVRSVGVDLSAALLPNCENTDSWHHPARLRLERVGGKQEAARSGRRWGVRRQLRCVSRELHGEAPLATGHRGAHGAEGRPGAGPRPADQARGGLAGWLPEAAGMQEPRVHGASRELQ